MSLLQMEGEPEEPEHYCFRAFRNRAMNYHRTLWRRVARELESIRWFEKSGGETEAEREAMHCLAELPPEQREVIVLKIWNEMTFEAIGRLFEISPNTVAGRYRYGLGKLKLCLQETIYERPESLGKAVALFDAPPPLG